MCRSMEHRGPDDWGAYMTERAGLAMRRLSIIDLDRGSQPIFNENRDRVIVFNGEIYNHVELRGVLEGLGHRFRTNSDTEVIIHAYEEFGNACVHKLRGVFAFAILDRDKLFCARDRFGVKPFYYFAGGNRFFFASEIKALFQVPSVPREINTEALPVYTALQYVPGPDTLFKGVYKLEPGHWLTVNRNGHRTTKYWRLPCMVRDRNGESPERTVDGLIDEAVRTRLMSDVPVGALLSGGLDSSLVVARAAKVSPKKIHTFHIGFADAPGFESEANKARKVARWVGTEHHELIVGSDVLFNLGKIIRNLDEPIADQAALPTYLICSVARKYVKVVLTGEGGDELFAGYPRYVLSDLADRYHRLPAFFRTAPTGPLVRAVNRVKHPAAFRVAKLLTADRNPALRHFNWVSVFSAAEIERLLTPEANPEDREIAGKYMGFYYEPDKATGLQRAIYADVNTWLVDDILTKVDKMSMAASVEARVPLLDHKLAEYVTSLPDRERIGQWNTKKLLKAVASEELPRSIIGRPKRPFSVPIGQWLKKRGRDMTWDLLTDGIARERCIFQPSFVGNLLESYFNNNGGRDTTQKVWNLLCFEVWCRTFIDRKPDIVQ
jgi:asparagine synthase (glutamine-hydrolysing)